METVVRKKKTLIQFIKFGMVGLSNTLLSFLIYNFCYHVCGFSYHVSNIFGFVISVLNAYLLQNKFVFKQDEGEKKRVWWKALIKTYVSYAFTGLILTEILLVLWMDVIEIQNIFESISWLNHWFSDNFTSYDFAITIAPIINLFITVPLNFVLNKLWAYK